MSKITNIKARQIFDSRGNPTIESEIQLEDGSKVQISKCPNKHGKIKSPLCCGQDMTCSVN